jgi:hypothetical protein
MPDSSAPHSTRVKAADGVCKFGIAGLEVRKQRASHGANVWCKMERPRGLALAVALPGQSAWTCYPGVWRVRLKLPPKLLQGLTIAGRVYVIFLHCGFNPIHQYPELWGC